MDVAQNHAFVIAKTAAGEVADFTERDGYDAANKLVVEAAFIRALMLGQATDADGNPAPVLMPGVRIRGVLVRGHLDLVDCAGAGGAGLPALSLEQCDLPDLINVSHSRLARFSISESRFRVLLGNCVRIDGDLSFSEAFPIDKDAPETFATIQLASARIGGDVWGYSSILRAARREGALRVALSLQQATIGGSLVLNTGMNVRGAVWLYGLKVGGELDCAGSTFSYPQDSALVLRRATVGGTVHLGDGFRAEGTVDLLGARIGGNLMCDGGTLECSSEGKAVIGEGVTIGGAALFRDGFKARGEVFLLGANVVGNLSCEGGAFDSDGQLCGLAITNAEIGGDLLLREFTCAGAVTLFGTRVRGDIELWEARLTHHNRYALIADSVVVGGCLSARDNTIDGAVSLAGSRFGRLLDAPETAWEGADAIHLDELSYTHLSARENARRPLWKARAKWLRRNTGKIGGRRRAFSNQPWRECAAAFTRAGLFQDARRIARAEQREANKHRDVWKRPFVFAFAELPFGYGLSVTRAAITSLLFWLVGWGGVELMQRNHVLIDSDSQRHAACTSIAAPLYALDVAIPVLDLRQESECEPGAAPGAKLRTGIDVGPVRVGEEITVWRWLKALYALLGAAVVGFSILTFSGVFRPKA